MILESCAFAVLILMGGFVTCWFADQVEALTESITCRCGRQSCAVSVVDQVDAARHAQALTEGCTHCREQAINRRNVETQKRRNVESRKRRRALEQAATGGPHVS